MSGSGGALGYVRRIARSSRSNFYYAFLILPREQREGIIAVYAFCRAADDAVDDAPDAQAAASEVARWERELDAAYAGTATHPIAVRAGEVARRFDLPREAFAQVLEGVACDIAPRRFATWDELAHYCDLVAGAVGRLAVRIFGHADAQADEYARNLGAALQVTNILRDLGPDAKVGRFYLPQEDLARFGLTEADVLGDHPRRGELLAFEAARARALFDRAVGLGRLWPRDMAAAAAMGAIYACLLDRIERAGFPAAGPPVRVPRPLKAWLVLRTLAASRL